MAYEPKQSQRSYLRNAGLAALGAVAALGGLEKAVQPVMAEDVQKAAYEAPTVKGAKYLGSKRFDGIEEIPGAETIGRYYETPEGTRFATLSVRSLKGNEKIWAYNIDTNGKAPFEFSLLVGGEGELIRVPIGKTNKIGDWVIDFYQKS